jgi:raffinose/stachyose/melibiose transport system permease protein
VNRPTARWGLTVLLGIAALTVVVPLYFAIAMSLKTSEQAVRGAGFDFPWPPNLASFAEAWTLTSFPRAFAVSAFVSAVTVAGTIVLGAMFIPFPVVALPQVTLTATLELDNPVGVAILHVMFQMSFSVLLYTAFLRSIPLELEESARLDGASTWQVFWKLIFPLLGPMNATIGIFAFLASWNDYMMPSMITADQRMQTIPVVQKVFQLAFSTNYNVAFASYLMALAPSIIVYVLAQRWVLSGVTRGAIK